MQSLQLLAAFFFSSSLSLSEDLSEVVVFAFEVKNVFDFREASAASRGMMVLLLKQVHLQKEVGARSNVRWNLYAEGA